MNARRSVVFFLCSTLLACDGGGSSSRSPAPSTQAEDGGAPDAAEAEDYTELNAALLAKLEVCNYREPDLSDADYAVEDSYDACIARCLIDARCDEVKSYGCRDTLEGATAECFAGCVPSISLPGGFACENGRSIPHDFLCDLAEDCASGEDEEGCGTFTCDDGQVVPAREARCNQREDCRDGSDEAGCKLSC